MPLLLAPENETLTVLTVRGDDKVRKHLESLGIVPEGKIIVLSQENGGVIVKINDTRLALDHNIARDILVK